MCICFPIFCSSGANCPIRCPDKDELSSTATLPLPAARVPEDHGTRPVRQYTEGQGDKAVENQC